MIPSDRSRPFRHELMRDGLLFLLIGTLLCWVPFPIHAGELSGWLVGLPVALGCLIVLQAIATLSEISVPVDAGYVRLGGAALLFIGVAVWAWAPHSASVVPLLGPTALRVYAGSIILFSGFVAGTASMRKAVSYWLLLLLTGILMTPFAWMILISLHPAKTPIPPLTQSLPLTAKPLLDHGLPVMVAGPDGKPTPKVEIVPDLHWENFKTVLFSPTLPVARFFFNTAFVTFTVVLFQLLTSSLAAYGLSRLRFRGRETIFWLFLGSMMLPGPVTQIPVYLILKSFGWLDTYWALIVPGVSSAFSVFLLRQFFLQIPLELDEAARIDGATDWTIYWRVILPLSRAALATAAAFTFFGVWTDIFGPLIYTSSTEMRTLEVGLSVFKTSYGSTNWPLQMTAALIVMAPLLIVFLFLQRFFTRGIMLGSIK